jgi:hypothetical protein
MAPLARRTWAPRGRTPGLVQKSGTREKVAVAAAVWLSPRRDRLGLYSHTLADGYFDSWHMAAFLEAMVKNLAGRFVVVWDGGPMHKGDPIRDLMSHFADRLDLERLPPYAPMLNRLTARAARSGSAASSSELTRSTLASGDPMPALIAVQRPGRGGLLAAPIMGARPRSGCPTGVEGFQSSCGASGRGRS